jgi:protein-S-isoprenylcysteine O-methyltransferase Ste14
MNLASTKLVSLIKSVLHNIGVVAVGLTLAFIGTRVDLYFGIADFASPVMTGAAWLLLTIGFLLRVWATYHFYLHRLRVIALQTQSVLITSGPYRFSRNPLYLGGNVFIFFGAGLLFGSATMLAFTALHLPLMDLFARREEKQLEKQFGDEWRRYSQGVPRWLSYKPLVHG